MTYLLSFKITNFTDLRDPVFLYALHTVMQSVLAGVLFIREYVLS